MLPGRREQCGTMLARAGRAVVARAGESGGRELGQFFSDCQAVLSLPFMRQSGPRRPGLKREIINYHKCLSQLVG